jgi:hypothetical protein
VSLPKRACLLVLALSILGLAQAATSIQDYFALRPGLRWSYSNNTSQEILAVRKVNGQSVLVLKHFVEGKPTSEDYLQIVEGNGVFYYGTKATIGKKPQLTWYNPPLALYPKGPIEVGQTWQSSSTIGKATITLAARVISTEGLVTKAGRYNALVIRSQITTSGGASSVSDAYFVPAIGTVRFVTQDGSSVELVKQ